MSECLIEFKKVRKAFGPLTVLDDLNLRIEKDIVTTIIGRSGIGKSVLLKHIIGLLAPDRGQVLYNNRSLSEMSRAERKALKGRFSYMFQNMALFDSMTVFENIALRLNEKSKLPQSEIHDRVMREMERLDLSGNEHKYPSQLSGGMRKRVALARALITNPEIILFDEPTTGLDPIRKNAVHGMIARFQGQFGFTAVVVSHDIPDVFEISQKVAMLEGGKIVYSGTGEDILECDNPVVRRFILGQDNGAEME